MASLPISPPALKLSILVLVLSSVRVGSFGSVMFSSPLSAETVNKDYLLQVGLYSAFVRLLHTTAIWAILSVQIVKYVGDQVLGEDGAAHQGFVILSLNHVKPLFSILIVNKLFKSRLPHVSS